MRTLAGWPFSTRERTTAGLPASGDHLRQDLGGDVALARVLGCDPAIAGRMFPGDYRLHYRPSQRSVARCPDQRGPRRPRAIDTDDYPPAIPDPVTGHGYLPAKRCHGRTGRCAQVPVRLKA